MEERDNSGAPEAPQDSPKKEPADIGLLVGTVPEPRKKTGSARQPEQIVHDIPNTVGLSTIEGRSGDFLFTIGNIGSGKSTIQSFMVHRLASDSTMNYKPATVDGDSRSDAYLNGWVTNIANGYFPRRNIAGEVREFSVSFGRPGKPMLDLSFIEIAGEDIRSIVPRVDVHEKEDLKLNEHLEQYLREPGVKKRFMFISDAAANRRGEQREALVYGEDVLFSTLIRHLLRKSGIGLKRLDILFVAAKWDKVKSEFKNHKHYFESNFPQTLAIVAGSSRIHANFIPFSVGDVDVELDENGDATARITRWEKKYVNVVISWIYESFKQRRLEGVYPRINPSLWERIKSFFASLS